MKKILIIVITLAALVIGGVVISTQLNKDQSSDEKVLKVGTEGTYSPFSYRNKENKLVGFDVEVAEAVASKIGYKVEFVEAPWDSLIAGLDSGSSDVVFNQVAITDERKEKYNFSTPYNVSHSTLIVNNTNKTIKKFKDLKGKKAAQSLTSNFAQEAKDDGAEIVSTSGFSQSAELVISGQADVTLNDDTVFFDYMKNKPNAPLKRVDTSAQETKIAALLKKNDKELLDKINEALEALKQDGTLKKISEKYFDQDITG